MKHHIVLAEIPELDVGLANQPDKLRAQCQHRLELVDEMRQTLRDAADDPDVDPASLAPAIAHLDQVEAKVCKILDLLDS